MKPDNQTKIAILGMGFLMEYIRPCYENLLGENLATNLIATKFSDRDLERKRKECGFEICAGNNRAVLERLAPDIILLAAQPTKIHGIVENDLLPYYSALRAKKQPLPDLYCFPPEPLPRFYYDTLGSDIHAVNLLPSMIKEVHGLQVGKIGFSITTFDERYPWQEENLARLRRFVAPLGQLAITEQDLFIPTMVGKVLAHNTYELCYTLQDGLQAGGTAVSIAQLAGCMRAHMRTLEPEYAPNPYPCSTGELPAPLSRFVCATVEGWYRGMLRFAHKLELDVPVFSLTSRGKMDLLLLTAQFDTRAELEYTTSCHATKGGVLEKACRCFAEYCEAPLRASIAAYQSNTLPEGWWDQLSALSCRVGVEVTEHTRSLSRPRA